MRCAFDKAHSGPWMAIREDKMGDRKTSEEAAADEREGGLG